MTTMVNDTWGRILSDGKRMVIDMGDGTIMSCECAFMTSICQEHESVDISTFGSGRRAVPTGSIRLSLEIMLTDGVTLSQGELKLPGNVEDMTVRELLVVVQEKIKEKD